MMRHYGYNYCQAFEYVRRARHWIDPNKGFRKQLKKHQHIIDKTIVAVPEELEKDYDHASQVLGLMYQKRKIKQDLIRKIANTYISIFGMEHQFSIDVYEEMQNFA